MLDVSPVQAPPPTVDSLWLSVQPTAREVQRARRRLHLKGVGIAALAGVSYWALVVADFPLPVRVVAAVLLAGALVAVGTGIMHDANHGSYSTRAWVNRILAFTSDALGASSWLWRIQHNSLHHGNTNVVGHDADLELAPFARLAPSQPWRWWYRAQHFYMWPLYGFLAMKNLLVSDMISVLRRQMNGKPFRQPLRPRIVMGITVGKLGHLGWAVVVPLLFNPWQAVLLFYVACSWMVGFALAVTFQLAHCVDIAEVRDDDPARRGSDFAAHQMTTTANVDSPVPLVGHLFRWLVGGLDHQIEHHLAPRLPHTLYPKVAARFREACERHGVRYNVHRSISTAIRSHARWLREMSQPRGASRAAPARSDSPVCDSVGCPDAREAVHLHPRG